MIIIYYLLKNLVETSTILITLLCIFFLDICKVALNKTAPLKQEFVRANNSTFMNKPISRAIMKRTRNRFSKDMYDSNRVACNTQGNYCVSLVRKAKKSY